MQLLEVPTGAVVQTRDQWHVNCLENVTILTLRRFNNL